MITRDIAQARCVVAFDSASYDASCGSMNGDNSAAFADELFEAAFRLFAPFVAVIIQNN